MPSVYSYADALEAEFVTAAGNPCGFTCECHGGNVCARAPHSHEDGDAVPHAGRDAAGQLVQWNCLGETPIPVPLLETPPVSKAETTRTFLAGLDLTVLADALAGPLAEALQRTQSAAPGGHR